MVFARGVLSPRFRDSHDNLLIEEVQKLKLLIDQLSQLAVLLSGDLSNNDLLHRLRLGLLQVVLWLVHLRLCSFKDHKAILDDRIAQKLYDYHKDLEAALASGQ